MNEEAFCTVFRALAEESLAPVSVGRLVDAAVVALAEAGVTQGVTPPPEVRSDLRAAERFLCERVTALSDPYPVVRALVHVANDPHTVLFKNQGGASMMAIVTGAPSTDPGMAFQRLDDGRLVVSEVVPGGAASSCGIETGDVVCTIAGARPTRGMEALAAVLSVPEGSVVAIEVERAGERRGLSLKATQALLPVVARRLVEGELGYVRLRWITMAKDPDRDTSTLLRRALDELAREGARAIVLDLRGNQGGYGITLVASVLTDGDPIVVYRQRSGAEESGARVGERSSVRLPLAVLVDDETNSAAEMVALSLQQHGDARIFGRPTAGGLNVPVRKMIGDEHVLMVPGSHVLGPRTRAPNADMRIVPDVLLPSRTAEDLANARDPQLDAVRRELALATRRG